MKQIAIVSGKGGTGKTVIAGSFASIVGNVAEDGKVMVDCDVDAANLHLLLHPTIRETHQFTAGKKAIIDRERCDGCGRCREVCRYGAISSDYVVDGIACEGCGVCSFICPETAVRMAENSSGEWYISDTKYGPFVHARLGIGEQNSGKLVTEVRKQAKILAQRDSVRCVIIDGPPGIGCPVIASLGGVDMALIVTESTLSGIHDMERILGVTKHFNINALVCINKYDLNLRNTQSIESYCQRSGIEIVGKIPFDPVVVESVRHGIPVVEYSDSGAADQIRTICDQVLSRV